MKQIYLDNNATTFLLDEVRDYLFELLSSPLGNPSSAHSTGEMARKLLESSRSIIAEFLGSSSEQLFFTSSGTESNNWVFQSVLTSSSTPNRVLTTPIEHSSIVKGEGYWLSKDTDFDFLSVDSNGLVNLEELEIELQKKPTGLLSVQWVNNETGVIQPIEEIGQLAQKYGVLFHTDAAQSIGKIPVYLQDFPIDLLTCTSHKLHAPAGTGLLYSKQPEQLRPLFYGGSQEKGIRPGTENLVGIACFAKAVQLRSSRLKIVNQHMQELRDYFEQKVLDEIENVRVNGAKNRVGNTSNLCFSGLDGQALLARLDMEGILCSQSSACTNQRPEPSYVLRAMGLSEDDAYSSMRFSFSEQNTLEEVEQVVESLKKLTQQLRLFFL